MSENAELIKRAEELVQQVAKDKVEIQALVKKLDDVQAPAIQQSKDDMKNILTSLGANINDDTPLSDYADIIKKTSTEFSAVVMGIVNDDLNFQPVVFNGKDPVPDGAPITVNEYYSWNNNRITVSGVPIISCTQYDYVEFDVAPFVSSQSGDLKFYSDNLPDGLSLDGSVISGSPMVYGSFSSTVIVSCYGAADKILNIQFVTEEAQLPSGAIFHATLSSTTDTAETGQTLVTTGTQSYTTFSGIPCVLIESGYIETSENSGIEGTASRTVSFWAYPTTGQTYCATVSIGGTDRTFGQLFNCGTRLSGSSLNYEFTTWGNDIDVSFGTADNLLHHFVYVYNSESPNALTVFVDGVSHTHSVSGINTVNGKIRMGESTAGGWSYTGYLSNVRVYDRVLSEGEIMLLHKEIQPVKEV